MQMLTWSAAYYVSEWLIRLVMLFYVPNRRSPAAARTWLLLIFLLPWPGLILYAAIGRIYLPKKRIEQQNLASQKIRAARFQLRSVSAASGQTASPEVERAAALASSLGDFKPLGGNDIQLLTDYQVSLELLIADIEAARFHVHLLYYIFENDKAGNRVADALLAAAKRGANCRVLMDAVGSGRGLRRLAPRLRAGGVEVTAVMPVSIFRRYPRKGARIDLRNHRKVAVIDGRVGYTGSQNIVDPLFLKDCPNEELVARVAGPVVAHLQAIFFVDRAIETDMMLDEPELFPEFTCAPVGTSVAQLLPSGPGYGRANVQAWMVDLIHAAEKRIVITTPYFVPDQPFLQAMQTAVLRGAEVHLVVPARSNQRITFLAQQSYYAELLESGIKIHLYQPHFLHAKHLSIDDRVALIGSSNIDIRSFALNAEVSLLVYDPAVVAQLHAIQDRYFAHSDELTREAWDQRSVLRRTSQNIARLADSLL
jgi:cardiolipin synthase